MKMELEYDETDPTQVANGLTRLLSAALRLGVSVEPQDGSYVVSSTGDEECVRRWVGNDGEFRRDVMERRWVVRESTDASGRNLPVAAA
jgi:hypothetical protein